MGISTSHCERKDRQDEPIEEQVVYQLPDEELLTAEATNKGSCHLSLRRRGYLETMSNKSRLNKCV